MRLALAFSLIALPAVAGVDEAVNDVILPDLATFTTTAEQLDVAAQANCSPDALKGPYNAAFDAWVAVSDVRLGPLEQGALSIAFWPDKRGFTEKTLTRLISDEDDIIDTPESFAEVSIAARGMFALERMLYDPDFNVYATGSYACDLVRALTRDLRRQAVAIEAGWRDTFADLLLSPGGQGNATYLDRSEAQRAIYTQILNALEFTADSRLGRPLGEVTRPRPTRAEAWRAGRSLDNVLIATEQAVTLARALADWEIPETEAALARVQAAARDIEDPSFQSIGGDLMKRLKLEILQQEIDGVSNAIEAEVGTRYGITPGFNASDGD